MTPPPLIAGHLLSEWGGFAPLLLRRQRAVALRHPLEEAAHDHAVGVRHDVDQALLTELGEPRLLGLHHVLVLDEGRRDLAIELLGRLGLVLAIAVGAGPEIEARGLGLRRQAMEQAELEAILALASIDLLVSARPDVGGAGPLQHRAGRDPFELLPAIDPSLEPRGP